MSIFDLCHMDQDISNTDMKVSAIVAIARKGVIGLDNGIPWHLPADLQHFKRKTLHHHIIMGRKSFESIGRPLPHRTNVVVSRDPFYLASGCLIVHSVDQALELALENGETEAFIIGGAEIYRQSMPFWDLLYITEVDVEVDGDTFFPAVDWNEWRLLHQESHLPDEKNPYSYHFKTYERIGS